jgi:hypothetical protein
VLGGKVIIDDYALIEGGWVGRGMRRRDSLMRKLIRRMPDETFC